MLLYDVGVLCVGCALIDMLVKGSGDVNLTYKNILAARLKGIC